MTEIAPGWEVVARQTNRPLLHMLFILLQMMLESPPVNRSSVTFTVRNRATGETRKVTARSTDEAAVLIAQGQSDNA